MTPHRAAALRSTAPGHSWGLGSRSAPTSRPPFARPARATRGGFYLLPTTSSIPGPPPGAGLAEVPSLAGQGAGHTGARQSTVASPSQSGVALFESAINIASVQVLRTVLADAQLPLAWQARFVAAFNVITTDRADRGLQRQVQSLFLASCDCDPDRCRAPDPNWTPPVHHSALPRLDQPGRTEVSAGAAQQVLTAFLGPMALRHPSRDQPHRPGLDPHVRQLVTDHARSHRRPTSGKGSTSALRRRRRAGRSVEVARYDLPG